MASGICFTVADLKTRLGISSTTYDAAFAAVLDGVHASIVSFLGFPPEESEITEYLDTKGQAEICLRRWPVESVTAVYLDEGGNYGTTTDSFAAATLLTSGTDYSWAYVDGQRKVGVLRRIGTKWPWRMSTAPNRLAPTLDVCPGAVKVQYLVDNQLVMAAAKEAGLLEAAARWAMRNTGMGAMLSESIDGMSRTVSPFQPRSSGKIAGDNFASPLVALMLVPYRITPMR